MASAADIARVKREVDAWARRLKVQPRRVEMRRMTRKWASCSSAGRICLSYDLTTAASRFRTYVILHELLHLRYPNHGKVFRRLLATLGGLSAREVREHLGVSSEAATR